MAEPFTYSVWLVPVPPLRDMLAGVISELAQRFGTLAFTPHVTVCSGKWGDNLDDLKRKADDLTSSIQPMTLAAHGIGCGEKRTTFFYLKLDNDQARLLFAQAQRALPGSHSPAIGAHLSLMYAEPNADIDRNALATELTDLVPRQIDFDELQLVTPLRNEKPTDHWHTQYSIRLCR